MHIFYIGFACYFAEKMAVIVFRTSVSASIGTFCSTALCGWRFLRSVVGAFQEMPKEAFPSSLGVLKLLVCFLVFVHNPREGFATSMSHSLQAIKMYAALPPDQEMYLFQGVHEVGAEGIMVDVWWGLCEKRPGKYDFAPYLELMGKCVFLLDLSCVCNFVPRLKLVGRCNVS